MPFSSLVGGEGAKRVVVDEPTFAFKEPHLGQAILLPRLSYGANPFKAFDLYHLDNPFIFSLTSKHLYDLLLVALLLAHIEPQF